MNKMISIQMARIAGLALLIAVLWLPACDKSSAKKGEAVDYEKILADTAADLNKALPLMIDPETRYDSVKSGPGLMFSYFYTLVNTSPGEMNQERLNEDIRPVLLKALQNNKTMDGFRKYKVAVSYIFRANDGSRIGELVFKDGEY